jgi:hypothetical protein
VLHQYQGAELRAWPQRAGRSRTMQGRSEMHIDRGRPCRPPGPPGSSLRASPMTACCPGLSERAGREPWLAVSFAGQVSTRAARQRAPGLQCEARTHAPFQRRCRGSRGPLECREHTRSGV